MVRKVEDFKPKEQDHKKQARTSTFCAEKTKPTSSHDSRLQLSLRHSMQIKEASQSSAIPTNPLWARIEKKTQNK